jgi:hypothetical protein
MKAAVEDLGKGKNNKQPLYCIHAPEAGCIAKGRATRSVNLVEKSSRRPPKKTIGSSASRRICAGLIWAIIFALLLASGWINQLHAQTSSPTTNAKIGKVFHETCQPSRDPRGHNHLSAALCILCGCCPTCAPRRAVPIYGKRSNISIRGMN